MTGEQEANPDSVRRPRVLALAAFFALAWGGAWGGGAPARAAEPYFPGVACVSRLQETARAWGAVGPWEADLPASDGAIVKRSPTARIGTWVEARLLGPRAQAARITARTVTLVTWEGGDCVPAVKVIRSRYNEKKMRKAFTDADLGALVRSNKQGLIYVWSPGMELSTRGLEQARAAAGRLGYPLTVLLDPAATEKDAVLAARRHGLPPGALRRVQAIELFYRGMATHYPALFVYHAGRMISYADPGYQPAARYVRFAQRRIAAE